MEQPLQTLFLQDLRPDVNVRFRPVVFLVVVAMGVFTVWAVYGNLRGLTFYPNPTFYLDPFLVYIAWGLIAALLSFKWEKAGA